MGGQPDKRPRGSAWEPWLVLIVLLVGVGLSHPMMRFGFDMWLHMGRIQDMAAGETLQLGRTLWYGPWAAVARIFGVEQITTLAHVVHFGQTVMSLLVVYAASRRVLSQLAPHRDRVVIGRYAVLATVIWLTIYATASVGWHQVWMLWYSLSYQITLPLSVLISALLAEQIYNTQGTASRWNWLWIVLLSLYVFKAHAMELVYVAMAATLMAITRIDALLRAITVRRLALCLLLAVMVALAVKLGYRDWHPEGLKVIRAGDWSSLWLKIQEYGQANVEGMNRRSAMWNELMTLSLALLIPLLLAVVVQQKRGLESGLQLRVLLFIALGSLLLWVPNFECSAGIASLISDVKLVNRFYYASWVFLVLPAVGLWADDALGGSRWGSAPRAGSRWLGLGLVLVVMVGTYLYSRYASESQNYYKNVASIQRAYRPAEIGVNYSMDTVRAVEQRLKDSDAQYGVNNYYIFARQDYAYIIKYVLRRKYVLLWNINQDFDPIEYEKSLRRVAEQGGKPLVIFSSKGLEADASYLNTFGIPRWPD